MLYKSAYRIGGEDAVKIVKELLKKGRSTEDEIARSTGVKLNEIRKILFKLHSFSLTFSESVQDKNTGWLIFYWRLQTDQMEAIIRMQKRRILEKLAVRLEYEKTHDFYFCYNSGCRRLTFEDAMESIFKCPQCGKNLQHFDNVEVVNALSYTVETLKKELESE